MADNGLLVTMSGAALSLLLYENVRSFGDQMGFLVGEVVVFVTKNVTDSDRPVEHKVTHIDVNTVMTCPQVSRLYNSVGGIDKERLKCLVGEEWKNIVGWFRFRQNGSLTPTVRDKVLHKELSSCFSDSRDKKESFAMCLLNSSVSELGGTHKHRHVFLRYKQRLFEPIPLRINNLGDDASRHDGSDYKPTPFKKSSDDNGAFGEIIKRLNLDLARTPGVALVTSIQKAAEHHLDKLIPSVSNSDRVVAELERQVRELKAMIIERQMANRSKEHITIRKVQKEKEDNTRTKANKDMVDFFCDEAQPTRSQATLVGQTPYSKKQKNLVIQPQKSVNVKPKNVNQDRARTMEKELNTSKANSSGGQDPFANIVSALKMDMTENSSNRTRRSIDNVSSESVRWPSIETGGGGRGLGRDCGPYSEVQQDSQGLKRPRRGGPRPKNVPERHLLGSQPLEQKSSNLLSKDSPALPVSYSQAARKSSDSNPTNTTRPKNTEEILKYYNI